MSSEHCPTLGGLSESGFNPEFDLKQLVLNPNSNYHVWGWLASGFLVLVTVTIASHTINEHLHHYCTPEIQRHKVRVVAYPAAYAVLAWLSYLKYDYETPYREKNAGLKEEVTTKVFGLYRFNLKSKWGLHFRVIVDILVLQFPIWNIIAAFISIITQIKGIYCDGQFSPKGAYVYLAIIQFSSLSIILMALFTYLSVFDKEWKDGNIRAHGMFWCVKGPIMIIFYCGDILLAILSYFNVIQDKPPGSPSGTYWTTEAIKNGYYVLIICVTMTVVAVLMQIYFGLDAKEYQTEEPEHNYFVALVDGFLAYIPQFIRNVFMCGGDTVVLAKKRIKLRKERRLSDDEYNLLAPAEDTTMPHEYLTQPAPSLQNSKLYDEDVRFNNRQQHNFNALSLEPLVSIIENEALQTSKDKDEKQVQILKEQEEKKEIKKAGARSSSLASIIIPPPPMQSRAIGRNDEVSVESVNQGPAHFTPHDLERN
ncbi:hypothetical protein RO3G_05574 [Rhizopus delemar RA 99-880]|uniref:Uncharacterized protein n=1 Tax=Rhizopus delemar (strain RA 99-880 / ATCC MYA-4621 / FGSC 9543 / NRRL 43880) TaxID=246409 RepID=I1BXD9_RHIO9|nr:hypothetical protein RO3G_05574 [Rhizopus delemar RA 99-880]|eukprot:EIE80869.1 hypothetical protein RO3G_05574 [Rhizopus delemar RA 99-880]